MQESPRITKLKFFFSNRMTSLFLRQMNFSSSHRWHHQLQFLCDFLVEFDHKMSDAYKHFHSDTVINIHETSNMEEFPFFFHGIDRAYMEHTWLYCEIYLRSRESICTQAFVDEKSFRFQLKWSNIVTV